jgi:hypothetical protein
MVRSVRSSAAGVLISCCSLAAEFAATVQDFLERYEVGETVGVGGEHII